MSTRRLTFEEVEKEFKNRGYTLLESNYKNAVTKMRYKCPEHPDRKLSITVHALKKGQGCPYCSKNAKITYDEAVREFNERGYKLLENSYKNNSTKMRYECPRHPYKEISITIKDLRNGHGCPYCAGLAPPTYKEVVNEFKMRGYELLETKYINATTKMKYRCPKHHHKIQSINLNKLRLGRGCRYCGIERRASILKGENHPNWKGGTLPLSHYLRTSNYITKWKQNAINKYGSKCYVTGEYSEDLEVHHTISFNLIRDKALKRSGLCMREKISDYSEEELEMIVCEFKLIHDKCEGIPLKREVHKLFHSLYGDDVTKKDIIDFKIKYNSNKFKQII